MTILTRDIDPLFGTTNLNVDGIDRSIIVREMFTEFLEDIKMYCHDGREWALVKTKLEEAHFYTQKSLASKPENCE